MTGQVFSEAYRDTALMPEVAEARAAMARLPGGGVPQLLVVKGGTQRVIQGPALYSGGEVVLEAIEGIDSASA